MTESAAPRVGGVPPESERAAGAALGYVLGAGFGASTQGRPLADTADEAWPAPADVAGPAGWLRDAAANLLGATSPEPVVGAEIDAIASPFEPAGSYAVGVVVGLAVPGDPVSRVVEECLARLDDGCGSDVVGAVCAVATALSVALAGGTWEESLALAMTAADQGGRAAPYVPGPSLAARLSWAHALATRAEDDPLDVIDLLVGAGVVTQETVPCAFAVVALHTDDPHRAVVAARRLGGNSAAIAAVAAALIGARVGTGVWPHDLRALAADALDVDAVCADLTSYRHRFTTPEDRP